MLKTKNLPIEPTLMFLIFVSLFGLALSFVFVATSGGASTDGFGLRKPLVGSVFGALCILGAFAAIYPSSCSRVFDYEKNIQHRGETKTTRSKHSRTPSHLQKFFSPHSKNPQQNILRYMYRFLSWRNHCLSRCRVILLRTIQLRSKAIHSSDNWCFCCVHRLIAFNPAWLQSRFLTLHR